MFLKIKNLRLNETSVLCISMSLSSGHGHSHSLFNGSVNHSHGGLEHHSKHLDRHGHGDHEGHGHSHEGHGHSHGGHGHSHGGHKEPHFHSENQLNRQSEDRGHMLDTFFSHLISSFRRAGIRLQQTDPAG